MTFLLYKVDVRKTQTHSVVYEKALALFFFF